MNHGILEISLANGADLEILQYDQILKQGVVLAHWKGGHQEHVTWNVFPSDDDPTVLNCSNGHYFKTRRAAYDDYRKRAAYGS